MLTRLSSSISIAFLVTWLIGCSDSPTDSKVKLGTPSEFTSVEVEGNSFSLSENGMKAAVWVNESLEKEPQWWAKHVTIADLSTMKVLKAFEKPWQLNANAGPACLNPAGDTVWYAVGYELYRAPLASSSGSFDGELTSVIMSLCYDPLRSTIYMYSGGNNETKISSTKVFQAPFNKEMLRIGKGASYRYGSQRMRMIGNDMLFTPNGYAVDVNTNTELWSIETEAAVISPTTYVRESDRILYIRNVGDDSQTQISFKHSETHFMDAAVASKDGKRVAIIYNTNSGMTTDICYISVYSIADRAEIYRIAPADQGVGDGHSEITDVEFSPVDNTVLYMIDREGNLCRWKLP